MGAKFDFSNMPRFIEAAKRGIQSGNMAVAKKAQNSKIGRAHV